MKRNLGISLPVISIGVTKGTGGSWSSWWMHIISALIANDAPSDIVVTFQSAKNVVASDLSCTVNGAARTISSATWIGAVLTITLASAVIYGDVVVITFVKTGQTKAVTNNVLWTPLLKDIGGEVLFVDSDHYTLDTGKISILTDLFGNSNDLAAAGADNRPSVTLDVLNGSAKITFNGVKNRVKKTVNISQPYTVYALYDLKTRTVADSMAGDAGATITAIGLLSNTGYTNIQAFAGSYLSGRSQGVNYVRSEVFVMNGVNSIIYEDGVKFTGAIGAANLTGVCWGAYHDADSVTMNFDGYTLIFYTGAHSYATVQKLLGYFENKYAIECGVNERLDQTWDNAINFLSDGAGYERRNCFAEFSFNTSDSSIKVKANPRIYATYPDYAVVSVYEDDVFLRDEQFTSWGEKTIVLSSGTKKVTLIEGAQTLVNLNGTHITSIKASNFTKVNKGNVAEKIVFFGDSITTGANSVNPERESFCRLFKHTKGKEVGVYAFGGATMGIFASTAALITASVSYATTLFSNVTTTKILVIALGTNDRGADTAAATFQGWYEALLDAIITAHATVQIYCLSPILRGDAKEDATLDDYRSRIATICAARSGSCTHIVGKTILTYPSDYEDTLHPSTAGHLKIYNALDAVIYP